MHLFLIIIFYLLLFSTAKPQTYAYVGIDVIHISDVDVKNQTFYAEFYLNMKWKGKHTATNFEFFDAKEIKKHFYEEWTESDTNWLTCKVKGTFRSTLDVTDYPLDSHQLIIKMSDFIWIEDSLTYLINPEISGISSLLSPIEWKIKEYNFYVKTLQEKGDKFSTVEFVINIERKLTPFIIKILIPIIIIMCISFLSLWLPKKEIEACIALGVTSLLSLIALHFSISNHLPDVDYATKIDLLMIGSYFLIFLSLIQVVYRYNLNEFTSKYVSVRKYSRWLFPVSYALFLIILFTPPWFIFG